MNTAVKNTFVIDKIFEVSEKNFSMLAVEIFRFQYQHNPVYAQYCQLLNTDVAGVDCIEKIPFLPIRFFKSHAVTTTAFLPETVFESSGTTGPVNSRHLVKEVALYKKSFTETFRLFYGNPSGYCIIGLLPSYLERNNSSLVLMVDELIKQSNHPQSGFYLHEFEKLSATLNQLQKQHQPTLLIGVTFALLDFAAAYPINLSSAIVMETGGMKGRKEEMTRPQVHHKLATAFGLQQVHAEYGMTELLSQAYSNGGGLFSCPRYMKVLIREEDDPFHVQSSPANKSINGAINIIDLANIYSCSFIATEDAGRLHPDGSFEVLGRLDNTDIRGCSLMAL